MFQRMNQVSACAMEGLRSRGLVALLLAGVSIVALAGSARAQVPEWTKVTPIPTPRSDHAMAYDSARQRVVLFGGDLGYSGYFGETWEWDGANWTQVSSGGPSARSRHAMAYDSARQRVVLFGGYGGDRFDDTWIYGSGTPGVAWYFW